MKRMLVTGLICALVSVIDGATSSPAVSAPSPSPTPTVVPITIRDTMLDISHAGIVASIVGCDIQKNDLVLVNGVPADGVLWDRLRIVPKSTASITPFQARLLEALHQQPTEIMPTVSFRIKSEYYNFALKVGGCYSKPFPLVAGDIYGNRHITVIMTPSPVQDTSEAAIGGTPTDTTGLYGDMPLSDLQILLTNADSKLFYVARTEDESDLLGNHYSFFFDAVKPGQYTMSVVGYGWSKSLGDFKVPLAGTPLYKHISLKDIGL